MADKQIIIDKVNVSGCEYLYTDSRYNDKCCSASIGGDSLCKPSEMLCVKYVEHLKEQLQTKEKECEKLKKQYNYKQALDEIGKYCAYMKAFNECNKTNKGLDVDEVLYIINKTKEIK